MHEKWLADTWRLIEENANETDQGHRVSLSPRGCLALLEERRARSQSVEPARRQLDTVAGLEMHAILHPHHLDTSPDLLPCPFCGHEGAFTDGHKRGVSDNYTVAAACSNTSCGVRTPEHYKDRASATVAWNRRALNRS